MNHSINTSSNNIQMSARHTSSYTNGYNAASSKI